jgi:hypothetical protein
MAMKNDNQAALDLFSNYSDFMLTDDELLAIHGGTTHSGTPGASSAPPPAAPAAPPTPAAPPNLSPASLTATVTLDLTPAATNAENQFAHSGTVGAVDDFGTHLVHAIDNFFFGPSTPPPQPLSGGAGGAEGSGGTGG